MAKKDEKVDYRCLVSLYLLLNLSFVFLRVASWEKRFLKNDQFFFFRNSSGTRAP